MRFIVDTQLPPRLAGYLRSKGYDCIHTTYFENGHLLQDTEIIVIALEEDRTIISKDADFSDHYFLKGAPPKILLLQFGNISNSDLIEYFEKYLDYIVQAFERGSDYVQFSREGIVAN
jgi:predicted nuclease of predicted toxin-antitoxin system